MKDSQPLMTTSVDGFHNENFAPFSYHTITNYLISTNCTTFLTKCQMPSNYLSTGKKTRSFQAIVFSVAEAIVEKLFYVRNRSTNISTSSSADLIATPTPETPSRNRTYFLDMPGRRFDEKDNIELI